MKMSPDEIRNQQFNRSFRGYDSKEVTDYLAQLATDIEEQMKQYQILVDKSIELETRLNDYKGMERMIQQTLMQAQETSAKAIENARRDAELIAQQTQMKITEMLDRARKELSSLKEQVTIHLAKKDSILSRLKLLLNSELDLIKSLENDPELKSVEIPKTGETSEIDDIIKNL